ncbi:MAG: IgGFc-binding protein, partial [Myxococcales bacterium]|nr:IgGFc-binding protein [Myxococcales bacterium]
VVDRDDAVRVAAIPFADISGTVIEADAPIWVAGAVGCAAVLDPDQTPSYCDHMQEVMRPIEQWGNEYVAVPAPRRAGEPHLWRIYAGAPQVSVSVDPPQPGFPLTLAQTGDRAELVVPNGTVLTITGDGPILPVQYVVSERLASGKGDSAMIQAVPRTAWLDRYVVGTGLRYSINYVQIVRPEGGAAVFVDGVEVVGYRSEQTVEIADWSVSEGTHVVTSAEPFGLSSYGYSNDVDGTKRSAYALPGGFSG